MFELLAMNANGEVAEDHLQTNYFRPMMSMLNVRVLEEVTGRVHTVHPAK